MILIHPDVADDLQRLSCVCILPGAQNRPATAHRSSSAPPFLAKAMPKHGTKRLVAMCACEQFAFCDKHHAKHFCKSLSWTQAASCQGSSFGLSHVTDRHSEFWSSFTFEMPFNVFSFI